MSTRNVVLGCTTAILLGVAIYLSLRGDTKQRTIPKQATAECVCLSCKQRSVANYSIREIAPHACPKCGQQALYPLLYCQDCKKLFVPNLEHRADDPLPRFPVVPACFACGSTRTGQHIPGMADQQPTGDPVLPKFP